MASDGQQSNGQPKDDPFVDKKDEGSPGPLFYAYARRTDNSWASRYLLTFASASIANEWWSLVQEEYPDAGVRTSPQLFSFTGDNFPYKPANSKKFEHLKTKWFYSQFGDASGTGGRAQDIIPTQDAEGNILGGGGASKGAVVEKSRSTSDDALGKGLQKIQEILESNASQLSSLAEAHSKSQERITRIEKAVEDNASQIKSLTEAQSIHCETLQQIAEQNKAQLKSHAKGQSTQQKLVQQVAEQNKEQLKSLADGQAEVTEQLQQASTSNAKSSTDVVKELKRQRQQAQKQAKPVVVEERNGCNHDVRPPPRKIDKPLVGYAYEKKTGGS